MKVFQKKVDKESRLPVIIAFGIPLLISILIICKSIFMEGSFLDKVYFSGGILLYSIGYVVIYTFFLVSDLTQKPILIKAKLINKKNEIYNGTEITYMTFQEIPDERYLEEDGEEFYPLEYKCYTIGTNNLIIENQYYLKFRGSSSNLKSVEELNSDVASYYENSQDDLRKEPIFIFFKAFLMVAMLFFLIGLIYYPKYTLHFIIIGVAAVLGLKILSKF